MAAALCIPLTDTPLSCATGCLPDPPLRYSDTRPADRMPPDMPPPFPMPHPARDHFPPAPQPHIPSSSLSPSPLFLLSHGTSPWHAATAGAGKLHGPQKSQAVRQSCRAARLCLANNPLMSFQKARGREKAQLQIVCFSSFLSLLAKFFFLMKHGGGET